ncbi:MAG: SIS domain-containing protein [Angelakisella sp.]
MNYIGIDEAVLKSKGGYDAAFEIERQPRLWCEIIDAVMSNKDRVEKFLSELKKEQNLKVLLVGAGSSGLAANVVKGHIAKKTGLDVACVNSTKLILDPTAYLQQDRPTLMVSFGSSGSTPEGVESLRLAKSIVKNLYQILILCVDDGILVKNNEGDEKTLFIPLPKETKGKSFAATAEFTCLVLQALLIFDLENIALYKDYFGSVRTEAKDFFAQKIEKVIDLANEETILISSLGSNEMEYLAKETALKAVEFSDGRYLSNYNTSLEFRHGPKLITSSKIITLFYINSDKYVAQYDIDMLKEICRDTNNSVTVAFGHCDKEQLGCSPEYYFQFGRHELLEKVPTTALFMYALAMHSLISHISLKLGVEIDWPNTKGLVPKVADKVTIYRKEI